MIFTDYEFESFSIAEKVVCDTLGVCIERVVKKDTSNEASMARNMLMYILHCERKISIRKIAFRYSRKERSVKSQISKMKSWVRNNNAYKVIYYTLCDEIKKGGKMQCHPNIRITE